jgi:ABC-type transport system substrate-binding protein
VNPLRKALIGGTIVASTLTGGALGAALIGGTAHAATTSTTAATATAPAATDPAPPAPRDPSLGGHMANGITETLLTGDTATKVKDAALAAVPGATIERVENDAEGATYEAHIVKSDGSQATVKLDGSFRVTGVEAGR